MRIIRISLCILVLYTITVKTEGAGSAAIVVPKDEKWSVIDSDFYTIHYSKVFEKDALKAKTFLDLTIKAMREEFSAHDPNTILRQISCNVFLHPKPNDKAGDGKSLCYTRYTKDGCQAELHFLTQSMYSAESKNVVGELKKADYTFHRYVVHEYSSIFLGVIVRSKLRGWFRNGNNAPSWFWQGYEEYLGMVHSSEHSRIVTYQKYLDIVRKNPSRIKVAFGLQIRDPYVDGFALLAFMHDCFGRERVHSVLTSDLETFGEAMKCSLETNLTDFHDTFKEWLKKP